MICVEAANLITQFDITELGCSEVQKNILYFLLVLIIFSADSVYGQRDAGIYFYSYANFSKEVSIASSSYSDLLVFENNVLTLSPIFIRHGWGAVTLSANVGYGYAERENNRLSPMTNYLGAFDYFNVSKERISLNLGFCYLLDGYERTEPFVKCNVGISSLKLSESFFAQDAQVAHLTFDTAPISTFKVEIGVSHFPEGESPSCGEDDVPIHYIIYNIPVNYGASLFFERNQNFSYFGLSFFVGIAGSIYLREILVF